MGCPSVKASLIVVVFGLFGEGLDAFPIVKLVTTSVLLVPLSFHMKAVILIVPLKVGASGYVLRFFILSTISVTLVPTSVSFREINAPVNVAYAQSSLLLPQSSELNGTNDSSVMSYCAFTSCTKKDKKTIVASSVSIFVLILVSPYVTFSF